MFAEPSMPDRHPSPGLSLNLSSNNPFRNRTASPLLSPASPFEQNRPSSDSRPMSRNPFLSTFEAEFNKEAKKTDLIDMSATVKESPRKATFGATEELFKSLDLDDEKRRRDEDARRRGPPRPAPNRSATDSRGEIPKRSDEEQRDRQREQRGPPRPRGPPGPRPPRQGSTERRENRRPRRNSESSMIDKGSLDPDEERRRRQRRREREERAKDGKDGKSGQRKVRRPQGLDLIDKLDVTGIYGPSMIHHDGPYDAVQPHRNRKKDARAPMEAFPVGSANNSLGGSGPLNAKIDLDRIHGRGAEGFTDFGGAETEWKKPAPPTTEFSAKGRADIIHGEQSHGLGTSTFLEGAPASQKAIQQETEAHRAAMLDGGLGRKKSIAQRFRGISQPRRFPGDGPRITSPDARYPPTSPNGPYSAGAISQTKATEPNPFFDEYNQAYDSKGAAIKETGVKDGPSSPSRNALHRATTSDGPGSPSAHEPKPSGGFLNRVKSLKGGRRRPA